MKSVITSWAKKIKKTGNSNLGQDNYPQGREIDMTRNAAIVNLQRKWEQQKLKKKKVSLFQFVNLCKLCKQQLVVDTTRYGYISSSKL